MTSLAFPATRPTRAAPLRDTLILAGAGLVGAMLTAAVARAGLGPVAALAQVNPWLAIHLATVIPAVPLGAWVLARPKGTPAHRMLGKLWAVLMIVTSVASFGIRQGHLSPIHLFSVITLLAIPRAIRAARQGRIADHVRGMTLTYLGLIGAGLFAFVPGRVFGDWLFG